MAAFKLDSVFFTLLPIVIAATCYPLGNRKTMQLSGEQLSTTERTYAMMLCSLPFWLLVSILGFIDAGFPSPTQLTQSFLVALFAGVIATLLFFKATDAVKADQRQLAVVESTQAAEVLFALLGGILLLGDALPDAWGFAGLALITLGMLANNLLCAQRG